MNEQITCKKCKKDNQKEIFMIEICDKILKCPNCNTYLDILKNVDEWMKNADELFVLLRPPLTQHDIPNPRLYFLYLDSYHTLLIGRYNASIVLMGVLLEALMKERIHLKLNIDFDKPYGACLKKIKDKKLMKIEDVQFLRYFKDKIRNLYQHSDEVGILNGIYHDVIPLHFNSKLTIDKLKEIMSDVNSGKLKPISLPVSEIPALRSAVKDIYDRNKSIYLFNRVYDFLIGANFDYFKEEEYKEHNKKFGTGLENIEHYEV